MPLSKIETNSLDVGQLGSRNVIMNGNFEINQRGVSSYTGLTGFTRGPDRWIWAKNDTVNFDAEYGTFSNTFTDIPEARGFMEFTLNSAGSGTDFVTIQQRIEDVRVCAGEEVTLTFWARSNTGSSFTLTEAASISHGPVAVQQIFGSGGSGAVNHVVASSITLNTAWTKYSYTFTMPSVSGKTLGTSHHTRLYLCTMMDSDAGKGVQIAQVQMERGKATPFEHRSYGEELALCQRYYQVVGRGRGSARGSATGGDQCAFSHRLVPEMRESPSVSLKSEGSSGCSFQQFANVNKAHVSMLVNVSSTSYWYINDGYYADAEL